MRHPLAGFGYYGDSADYSSRGIENSSADFSMTNEVNADEDFGKNCSIGDFGTYGREGEYGAGFEGFGHVDHFYGYHDEGLGFGIKIKKPKISAPKVVSKAVSVVAKPVAAVAKPVAAVAAPVIKPVAAVAAPVLKPVAAVAAPVLKPVAAVAAPVLQPALAPLAPILATSAAVSVPYLAPVISKEAKVEEKKKIKTNLKKIKGAGEIAKKVGPVAKEAKKLAKKAEELVKKKVVPTAAVTTGVSVLKPSAEVPSSSSEVITAQEAIQEQAEGKSAPIVVNSTYIHPLLLLHRRLKGETMSGFLDDLNKKQKKIVQSVIDKNKEKAIKAVTTQASNVVGKQLDKLSKTNPKAQQAITQVVASATETATAKAKESLAETVKSSFEQNKKYIILAGGGLIGLLALKMFMGRKA